MATIIPASFYLAQVARGLWQDRPVFKTFAILAGPNSGVFIDSEKDYPRGTRVSFPMTISSNAATVPNITLEGVIVESSARTQHRNKTWYVFVARHLGAIVEPQGSLQQKHLYYWSNFFDTDHLIAGEFCPETRKGTVCELIALLKAFNLPND